MLITSEPKKVNLRGDIKDCFLNTYKCDFCGLEWTQVSRKGYGETTEGGKNSKPVSTQVQCSRCKNFIPTWR